VNLQEYEAYLRSLGLAEEEIQRLLEEARQLSGPNFQTPNASKQAQVPPDELAAYLQTIGQQTGGAVKAAQPATSLTEGLALDEEYRQLYDELTKAGVEAPPPAAELGVQPADLKRLAKDLGWTGREMARWGGMLFGGEPIPEDAELYRMAKGAGISGTDLAYLVSELQRKREEQKQPVSGPLEALGRGFVRGLAESAGTVARGLETIGVLGEGRGEEIQRSLEAAVPAPRIDETSITSQVAKMVGETAGQMAPTVVPGLLAAPAGTAAAAGAAFAGSLLPNIGESASTLKETWGVDDPWIAVVAGTAKSILDTAAFQKGIGKAAKAGAAKLAPALLEAMKAEEPVARSFGKLLARGIFEATKRQAESAAWEATTEVVQDIIDRASGALASGDWQKFQENLWRDMSDTFTKVALGTFFGFAPVGAAKAAIGAVATSKGWIAGPPAQAAAEAFAQEEAAAWERAAKAAIEAVKAAEAASQGPIETAEAASLPLTVEPPSARAATGAPLQEQGAPSAQETALRKKADEGPENEVSVPSLAYLSRSPITFAEIPEDAGFSYAEALPEDPAEINARSYLVVSVPNRTAATLFLRKIAEASEAVFAKRPEAEDGTHPVAVAGEKTLIIPVGNRDGALALYMAQSLQARRIAVDRKAGRVSIWSSGPAFSQAATFSQAVSAAKATEERMKERFSKPELTYDLPRFSLGPGARRTLEVLGIEPNDLITAWAVTQARDPEKRPVQVADLGERVSRTLRSIGDRLGIKWVPFKPHGPTEYFAKTDYVTTVDGSRAVVVTLPLGVGSVLFAAAHEVAHRLADVAPAVVDYLHVLAGQIDPKIRERVRRFYPGATERKLRQEVAAETLQELVANRQLAKLFFQSLGDADARRVFFDLFRLARYAQLEIARRSGKRPGVRGVRAAETWFAGASSPAGYLIKQAARAFEDAVNMALAATPSNFPRATLSELLFHETEFRKKLEDLSASARNAYSQLVSGKKLLGQTAALAAYHAIAEGAEVPENHQAIFATFRPETWPTGASLVARDDSSVAEAKRVYAQVSAEADAAGDRYTAIGAKAAARLAERGVIFHGGDRSRPLPLGMPVWATRPEDVAFLLGNVAAAADAGASQRHWYLNQGAAIAMLAGDGDPKEAAERVRRIAYALAATSPRTTSQDNLRAVGAVLNAVNTAVAEGTKQDDAIVRAARETARRFWGKDIAAFDGALRLAVKALKGEWAPDPSTPKVYAFANQLIAGAKRALKLAGRGDIAAELEPDVSVPVVDSWIYRAFGIDPDVAKPNENHYTQVATAMRALAEELGRGVGELQAAIWGAVSTASGRIRALLGDAAEALFAGDARSPIPPRSRQTAELYRAAFERLAAEHPIVTNGGYFEHLLRELELAVTGDTTLPTIRGPVEYLAERMAPGRRKVVVFTRAGIVLAIEGASDSDAELARRIGSAVGGEAVLIRLPSVSEPTDAGLLDETSLPPLKGDEVPILALPAASSASIHRLLSEIERRLDGPAREYAHARGEALSTLSVMAGLPGGVSWILTGPAEAPTEVLEDWRRAAIQAAKEVFGGQEIIPVTAGVASRRFVDVDYRQAKASSARRAKRPDQEAGGRKKPVTPPATPPEVAERSEEMVRTATEQAARAQAEAEKAVELMRSWETATRRLRTAVSDRLAPAYDILAQVFGKDQARILTDRYRFSASPAEYVLMRFKEIQKRLEEAGVPMDQFGAFLFLRRVALEKYRWDEEEQTWVHDPEAGTAGRATVANPLGVDQDTAMAAAEQIYGAWSASQRVAVEEALAEILAINREVVDALESIQMLDAKGIEFLRANQFYSSFVPAEKFPSWVAATVKRQVGTDLSIVNPFWATAVKFASLLSFAQRHATVQATVEAAEAMGLARPREEMEGVSTEGLGTVSIYRAGRKVSYVVPQGLALAFQASPIYQGLAGEAIKIVNSFIQGVLVRYNPRFLGFNVPRDLRQALMQLQEVRTPADVARYLKTWAASVKEAWRLLRRGELGHLTEEALRESAVAIGYIGNFDEPAMMADISSAFAEALEKARIEAELEKAKARSRLAEIARASLGKAASPVKAVAKLLEDIGAAQEMASKIAGYHFLRSKGLTPDEAADKARNLIGTPNYRRAGRLAPIIQFLLPFTNVRKEGYRAIFIAARQDPLAFATKLAFFSVIPTALRWSLKTGLLWALYNAIAPKTGNDDDDREERQALAWLTEVFRRAIPGDLVNYDILPIALRRDGKAVYLRIPVDYDVQALNNLLWNALEAAAGRGEPAGFIADALAFVSGETPSLNPLIGFVADVSLASLGLNPPDTYRRMPKVPPNIFAARDWRTYAVLAKRDLVGLLGGYGFAVKPQWEAEALTPAEKMLLDNPVSRTLASWFVRRTDFGLRAEEKRIEEVARAEAARRALDMNEVVEETVAKGGTFADAAREATRRGLIPKSGQERARAMRSLIEMWKKAKKEAAQPQKLPRGIPAQAKREILDLRKTNEQMLLEALGEGED
jgi:hypothetical protein